MSIRMYRMTISSFWYDKVAQRAREYELHFKVARRGRIRSTRRQLALRGVPHFQQTVHRLFGQWIPKGDIRLAFEREEPTLATKSEPIIRIEARRMEGRGKRWKAFRLPSKVLSYVKKKRKRNSA